MQSFADIALLRHSKSTDQLYTYGITEKQLGLIKEGTRVIVSFGRGETPYEGYVMSIHTEKPPYKIKPIKAIFDDGGHLNTTQVAICKWLRDRTLCTWSEALTTMIPSGTALKRIVKWHPTASVSEHCLKDDETALINTLQRTQGETENLTPQEQKLGLKLKTKGLLEQEENFKSVVTEKNIYLIKSAIEEDELEQYLKKGNTRLDLYRDIVRFLNLVGATPVKEVKDAFGAQSSHIKTLIDKGIVERIQEREERVPIMLQEDTVEYFETLTADQAKAVEEISVLDASKPWLLYGVTGSGKTEVYLHLSRLVLEAGKQVVILVPEISLTPQIVGRFVRRFGSTVAVLHSRLTQGERFDQWTRIRRGEANVIIGPRSALFAPTENLGLVIMDEEHENAYKSESAPRFHSRELALWLSQYTGAKLILGSATPAIETYYKCALGQYRLAKLPSRVNANPMPTVHVIDMREEVMGGNRGLLSRPLSEAIEERLNKKEQVLIFMNKKGYASFLNCKSCGFVLKCPRCDISMTYFKGVHHTRCNYCGYAQAVSATCPDCGSSEYTHFGSGTEQLEEYLQNRYPQAVVARLDAETTSKKGKLERVIQQVEKGEVDILVGTQMVAKGLHFPGITLAGVLAADLTMNFPDYKANERTFQLLTQVAGRTGRGKHLGEVYIQTYQPEHYTIEHAAQQEYLGFYKSEARLRKAFRYPPFISMVNLIFQGENEEQVQKVAKELYNKIGSTLKAQQATFQMLGPHPAAYARIRGVWRYQILLKHLEQQTDLILEVLKAYRAIDLSGVTLLMDTQPVTTL